MVCEKCGGECWDNREKNKDRKLQGKKFLPEFACKDKDNCGWVKWPPKEKANKPNLPVPVSNDFEFLKLAVTIALETKNPTGEFMDMIKENYIALKRLFQDGNFLANKPPEPDVDLLNDF